MKRWESRHLGQTKEYLGMRITWDHKKRTISFWTKPAMRRKSLNDFGQKNCKPVPISLPTGYYPRPNSDQNSSKVTLRNHHQSVWWSLSYDMLRTRSDISLDQFTVRKKHLQKAIYEVRYSFSSKGTLHDTLRTCDTNGLCAYSDTDWAGNVETLRSTTGYAIFSGNSIAS